MRAGDCDKKPQEKHPIIDRSLAWDELSEWQQDNAYLIRGYRSLTSSYKKSIRSIFSIHNQTLNIHTHSVGLILFAALAYDLWQESAPFYASATHGDSVAFGSFFGGLFTCLSFSVAFHTFSNHSRCIYERFLLLDFLGILSLIAGSWIPGIYYGFFCRPTTSRIYWTMILTVTTACAITLSVPLFRSPAFHSFRVTLFTSLGLSGVAPMAYAAVEYGVSIAHAQMGWGWFVLEGVFYFSGVVIYASKVPEKSAPGRFDIVGSSHQIFHVSVLCGAGAHLAGIVQAFMYNHHPETRSC